MKSSHALCGNASPYHQIPSTMLDGFLGETWIEGLSGLYPAVLATIGLEEHEF
jgi:hypothetical protein